LESTLTGTVFESNALEEVTPMESIYMTQRPSMLLTPACAPIAVEPRHRETVVLTAAQRAPLSRVDWVSTQAELALIQGIGDSDEYGSTNGFVAIKGGASVKGATGGVPPRGRPV
jgi:hypothetical protein